MSKIMLYKDSEFVSAPEVLVVNSAINCVQSTAGCPKLCVETALNSFLGVMVVQSFLPQDFLL